MPSNKLTPYCLKIAIFIDLLHLNPSYISAIAWRIRSRLKLVHSTYDVHFGSVKILNTKLAEFIKLLCCMRNYLIIGSRLAAFSCRSSLEITDFEQLKQWAF